MKRLISALAALLLAPSTLVAAEPVLVDGDWVEAHLTDPNVVIVDMSTEPTQYQRFHLPGAVYLPYRALVQRRRDGVSMRVDDARLHQVLGMVGIEAEKHVVIYDDMGGLEAGRLFWELERIGHEKMSVLDGGLVRWILDGRKVVSGETQAPPSRYIPKAEMGLANEIDFGGIRQASSDGKVVLLDVRSEREYEGEPRDPRGGHVPGAHFWPWDASVNFDNGFNLKSSETLLESLKSAGVTDRDQPLAVYCQSGHRAAQSYLVLRSLGFSNVQLYDGSMAEYGRDRSAPLKRGKTP